MNFPELKEASLVRFFTLAATVILRVHMQLKYSKGLSGRPLRNEKFCENASGRGFQII